MTEINREYILRIYAIHERIDEEIEALADGLKRHGDADQITASLDQLRNLTGEAEMIFAEVLTDEERRIPTDEEFLMMVDKLIGKE